MLCYSIYRVAVAVNPFKFIDFSAFITLLDAYNVDYKSLLYGRRELYKVII
jgi:hypothetical protein